MRFLLDLVDVAAHAAEGVHRIMDAVAGDGVQDVHDHLAVAPGVHEKRFETGFLPGHAQPEQMAVHPFQLADQGADIEAALGRHQLHQFFHPLGVAGLVRKGADAADALGQVQVLDEGPALGQLFNAAVVVAQLQVGVADDLAVQGHAQADRFVQGGVLRT